MKNRKHMIKTTLIAFACFELGQLAPNCFGVVPAPDGAYPGGNTAEGQAALFGLTTGGYNTAVGYLSLSSDATNSFNTAIGAGTLLVNTADQNTATGAGALLSNTTGVNNTASGAFALFSNTEGAYNTAAGDQALLSNTTGIVNTAIGAGALASNTTGDRNTAIGGDYVLFGNATGSLNTAIGVNALTSNISSNNNTAVGAGALQNTTGGNNVALGHDAGHDLTNGDNNIDIGNEVIGLAGEHDTIRLGNTNIATTIIRGISGTTIPSGSMVLVAANGQLGTMTSSVRFKQEIKPMENASEALFALKPVTFRYKKEIDPHGVPQFGLVAEQVEKVSPDLVIHDAEGNPQTVRYEQVNAMLLNEFLKEHRAVLDLRKEVTALAATAKEQALQIQKVSARLDLQQPTLQTVAEIQ